MCHFRPNDLTSRSRTSGAFTLIELLVSIAIISVLLGLALSGLRYARQRAWRAVSLSNLKTHATVFSMYNNDFSGYFPYFTEPGLFNNTLKGGGFVRGAVSYFDANSTWHIVLADKYYHGNVESDVFFPPNWVEEVGSYWPLDTPYNYGCAFIANPRYWNPYTRTGPKQYHTTQAGAVSSPSLKVLIVESWPLNRDIRGDESLSSITIPSALCDGSAQLVSPINRIPGYEKGDGRQFRDSGAVHFNDWPPFLHTIDGVRGRDIR